MFVYYKSALNTLDIAMYYKDITISDIHLYLPSISKYNLLSTAHKNIYNTLIYALLNYGIASVDFLTEVYNIIVNIKTLSGILLHINRILKIFNISIICYNISYNSLLNEYEYDKNTFSDIVYDNTINIVCIKNKYYYCEDVIVLYNKDNHLENSITIDNITYNVTAKSCLNVTDYYKCSYYYNVMDTILLALDVNEFEYSNNFYTDLLNISRIAEVKFILYINVTYYDNKIVEIGTNKENIYSLLLYGNVNFTHILEIVKITKTDKRLHKKNIVCNIANIKKAISQYINHGSGIIDTKIYDYLMKDYDNYILTIYNNYINHKSVLLKK